MTAMEAVESAKSSGTVSGAADDVLYRAVERLEIMIEKLTKREHKELDREAPLLACGGGVAIGYDEMYDAYIKREGCRIREDWECYGNYDTMFAIEWKKLETEYVRNHEPEPQRFKPDWRW